jgi:hypothetical protein
MTCSFDGQKPLPRNGNTTLTDLANIPHNVIIYAIDECGCTGLSDPLSFNVNVPECPVVALIVVTFIVMSVVAGLLVYFRKRKR